MRLAADLSHYVVDREMPCPPPPAMQQLIARILERSDSFQGRVAARGQIQVALNFPQNAKWVALFREWWLQGIRRMVRAAQGREFLPGISVRTRAARLCDHRCRGPGIVGSLDGGRPIGAVGARDLEPSLRRGLNCRSSDSEQPILPTVSWRAPRSMMHGATRSHAMSINKDQVEGRVKEAAGKVQESAGKAVGSTHQEIKGNIKKNTGAAQARYRRCQKGTGRREEGPGAFEVGASRGACAVQGAVQGSGPAPAAGQMAIRTAPPVIKRLPSPTFHVSRSPRNSIANSTTKTTLSLSMGATRDAGPVCSAR